jgi:hypothetical protein
MGIYSSGIGEKSLIVAIYRAFSAARPAALPNSHALCDRSGLLWWQFAVFRRKLRLLAFFQKNLGGSS